MDGQMDSGEKNYLARYCEPSFIGANLAVVSIYSFYFMSAETLNLRRRNESLCWKLA